jgi:peptidoglycan/LPS O-acetylase OafA/YrhL
MTAQEIKQLKVIPSLNGLRAISVLLVLVSHLQHTGGLPEYYEPIVKKFIGLGSSGVYFFFIISGFLITHLLIREYQFSNTIDFRKFYVRRFLRLAPVLVLYLFAVGLFDFFSAELFISATEYIEALFYLSNLDIGYWSNIHITYTKMLRHFWSLAAEEQFYLIWPIVLFFVIRKKYFKYIIPILLLIAFTGTTLSGGLLHLHNETHISILYIIGKVLSSFDGFAIGCLIGILFHKKPEWINKFKGHSVVCSIAFLLLIATTLDFNFGFVESIPLVLFRYMCIVYILLYSLMSTGSFWYKILNTRIFNYVGLLSYSLYVWHMFFFTWKEEPYAYQHTKFPVNLLLTVVVGIISYELFEKKFLLLKERFRVLN